jgi:hypothetical protein
MPPDPFNVGTRKADGSTEAWRALHGEGLYTVFISSDVVVAIRTRTAGPYWLHGTEFWSDNMMWEDHLGDAGVVGKVTLKSVRGFISSQIPIMCVNYRVLINEPTRYNVLLRMLLSLGIFKIYSMGDESTIRVKKMNKGDKG